jgi:parallel beta-helix repeat protein
MAGTLSVYNKHSRGIYLDATSIGVQVLNNTIFDCWEGICVTQSQNSLVRGNTVYNTGNYNPSLNYFSGALVINDANNGYAHNSNNKINSNIFFTKNYDQLLYHQTDVTDSIGSVGVIDSNYYANPWTDMPVYLTNTTPSSILKTYSLPLWNRAFSNYDKNSKGTPIKLPQYTYTFVGSNKIPNSTFTGNITGASASSSPAVHSLTWDNTSQITAGGSAKLTSSVTSANFTSFYEIIGAIDGNKSYVLRFKTKGSKIGSFKTYLQQWSGTYPILTSAQAGSIDTSVQQHEIIFTGEHSTQSSAAVFIQFSQNSGSVYIDDIEFYEANVTPTNVDDYIRFEYNTTNSPKTISLDAKYIGVDSTVYNGVVTLQPYSSIVLIKTGIIEAALKADAGTDITLLLPVNYTILKGSAVGTITSYSWRKISGPSQFSIASPSTPSTAISNLSVGKYTFQLKVINNAGDSALSIVTVTQSGILPVTLIDFTAKNNNDKVNLQWQVASEINVSHYAIERSSNGQDFENIGELNANNIADIQINYNFADNFPLKGTSYYRLVMIDIDGSIAYSKTVYVSVTNAASFTLLNVALSASNSNIKTIVNSNSQQVMQVILADVSGRIVYSTAIQLQKGFNVIDKKINTINTGVYYAKLFTSDQVITKTLLSGH